MEDALRLFLQELGEDPERRNLRKTPALWKDAMTFLTSGYGQKPEDVAGDGLFPAETHDLVLLKGIEFSSLCEHHLLPFFGTVRVGYVPGEIMIGLGKIPRIVDLFARRLQTQERMTGEIADALVSLLHPRGLGVVIEAEHCCMMMRGLRKRATVVTSRLRGLMETSAAVREEFLTTHMST